MCWNLLYFWTCVIDMWHTHPLYREVAVSWYSSQVSKNWNKDGVLQLHEGFVAGLTA